MIIAHLAGGAELGLLDQLVIVLVISRVLYWLCVLADWAPVRSLVWFVGIGLFVVSA